MDVKVYDADLKRIDQCMDKLLEIMDDEKMECQFEKKFIDYFKKKYIELPWMRYQLSLYFNHAKEAYSKKDEKKGKEFYAAYLQIKEEISVKKSEIDDIKVKNMYY